MNPRFASVAATGSAALATAIMLSPSAQAVDLGIIAWNGTTLTPSSLNAQPLDTFTLSNTSGYTVQVIGNVKDNTNITCSGGMFCTAPTGTIFTATVVGVGQVQIENYATHTVVTSFYTNGSGGSSSSSSSSTVSSSPPPVVQQFGRPPSGTCADAAPITLNWGGASSGGWSESWAQWMNSGNGGAVCTRTLSYSAGAWSAG
jgi:hypothetical protein